MRLILAKCLFICGFFVAMSAQAEYRAFELSIENIETGVARTIVTTFDQNQYRQYYPVAANEVVKYVSSWMCWENTGNRPICKPTLSSAAK